jgi:ABC-2 type transport system ATP-binding protein
VLATFAAHSMTPEPAISVRGLVKTYGDRRAVTGLDLEVPPGECLGLLGPNGAGKTTTIKVLSTALAPSAGEVRVLGLDPGRQADALRARIGVVPQDLAVYEALSARENLEFFGQLYGLTGTRLAERVGWGLAVAGLESRAASRVKEFSGGMKRRLNLVAALLHEPELVFLDEPTVGIDPQSRNHVFEVIERELRGRVTVVYTTHQLGEVERLCDRIAIMDGGRVVAVGGMDALQASARAASGGDDVLDLEAGQDVDAAAELLRAHGYRVGVRDGAADLETIFLALTGKALRDDE